ncbi:LIM and SH3 domain protein F42H10.3-like isoform X2 [Apostichopus japonicus]|uniref:LIM and SH3 domain protein F42H10.3-like isoform X2 n=1 Tax=Stichopus japonicus TaxID=307972 RepID=UPI003AB8DED3
MNQKCPNCCKTVYPVEKLSALDQTWHKSCFKCDVCGLTLNMKTYKGYNKRPYCNTHYPTTRFTAVADTPENLRIKKNTTQQSQILYTKDQQNLRGTKLSVADDPETQRIKKNTDNQSGVKYHNLAEQRAAENLRRDEAADSLAGTYRQDAMPPPQQYEPPAPEPYHQPEPEDEPVGQPQQPKQVGSLFAGEPAESAPPAPGGFNQGPAYVAIYDYVAAADDEISFVEGDIIINGEIIDDGWMTGTVERTGHSGMLPSNYVEER